MIFVLRHDFLFLKPSKVKEGITHGIAVILIMLYISRKLHQNQSNKTNMSLTQDMELVQRLIQVNHSFIFFGLGLCLS